MTSQVIAELLDIFRSSLHRWPAKHDRSTTSGDDVPSKAIFSGLFSSRALYVSEAHMYILLAFVCTWNKVWWPNQTVWCPNVNDLIRKSSNNRWWSGADPGGWALGRAPHPWGGVLPFKMHYSIAFKHQSITGRPPLGEILYPPLVVAIIPMFAVSANERDNL